MMLILWQSLDIHKSILKEQIYIYCQKYIQRLLNIDESFNKWSHASKEAWNGKLKTSKVIVHNVLNWLWSRLISTSCWLKYCWLQPKAHKWTTL
jgi:hypothetical protein